MESDSNCTSLKESLHCPKCSEPRANLRGLSVHLALIHKINGLEAFELVFPGRAAQESTCTCGRTRKFAGLTCGFAPCGPCSRAEKTRGRPTWNAGLTKETSASVASTSAKLHERYSTIGTHVAGWSTRAGAEERKQKIKRALAAHYEEHEHHTLGLRAETTPWIAERGRQISKALTGRPLSDVHRASLLRSHGLDPETVAARFAARGFTLIGEWQVSRVKCTIACHKCGANQEKTLHAVEHGSRCEKCHPPWACKTSAWQREVAEWVRSLGLEVVENDRKQLGGLEIDVWIPSKKVGVECHGLYWHSERTGRFEPDHCQRKADAARRAGIVLVQIFDDEWRDKRPIVESMIRHRLGLTAKKLHARKLELRKISWSEAKRFYEANHADGAGSPCPASYGLFEKDGELTSALSIARGSHGSDSTTMEIKRAATAIGCSVAGGLAKLVRAAQLDAWPEAERLLAYADERHGRMGEGYERVGFSLAEKTKPRFWWTDGSARLDRFAVRAIGERPEWAVAAEQGVWRVYGCGNSKWTMPLNADRSLPTPSRASL